MFGGVSKGVSLFLTRLRSCQWALSYDNGATWVVSVFGPITLVTVDKSNT